MRERVKITDLARELGVSTTTVSRALSNEGRIGAKTKESVIQLAKKWGYKPNPFAVNLLKKKSKLIGLILPEFTHHYFGKVLSGVNRMVNEHGYQLIINIHEGSMQREVEILNMLSTMRVDGIIASYARETTSFDHYLDVLEDNVPIVFVDRMCEDLDTSHVISDDFDGCLQGVDQLVKSGCRRIAHIAGPENLSTSFTRKVGYKEGVKRNGLSIDQELIISSDNPDWTSQLEALVMAKKLDAILAFTDYLAFEAIECIKKLDVKVPQEVSVVGFADEPIAQHMAPRLSTIRQPAVEMGQRAAEILMWHIDNPTSSDIFCESMPTSLICRESTTGKLGTKESRDSIKLLKHAS